MKRIVVITGAAPYLGGPSTWLPLRQAAPDLGFIEVDALDFADSADISAACRQVTLEAAEDADCVVAHNAAAKPAIEAVAQMSRPPPVLLLSPILVQRSTPALQIIRSLINSNIGKQILTALARSKQARLVSDKQFLKNQLALLIGEAHITDAMVEEAAARVADPRTVRVVERTAEVVLALTSPIDPAIDAKVQNRTVLLGNSRLDRKTAARMQATVIPDIWSAPMIEAPQVVAQVLREILNSTRL
jgi:hypothetical protein